MFLAVLVLALASHAVSGLLTPDVGYATLAALPGTIGGAWVGSLIYRRLGDLGYQRVILALLFLGGGTRWKRWMLAYQSCWRKCVRMTYSF